MQRRLDLVQRAAALVVPQGVSDVIQRRVARVSQDCAALLAIAAVTAETCAGVIETDLVEPQEILAEAVAAGLLEERPQARDSGTRSSER